MRDGSTELADCGNSFIGYVSAIRDEMQPCLLSTVSEKYGTATAVRTEFLETVYFSECEGKCAITAVTKTGKEITLYRGTKNECLGYYKELCREVPELCRQTYGGTCREKIEY